MIVANVTLSPRKFLALRGDRGAQEGIFTELQSRTQMDCIPCGRCAAERTSHLSAIIVYSLNRELQMSVEDSQRSTTERRGPRWCIARPGTGRGRLIQHAGRATSSKRRLTLRRSAIRAVQAERLHHPKVA